MMIDILLVLFCHPFLQPRDEQMSAETLVFTADVAKATAPIYQKLADQYSRAVDGRSRRISIKSIA